MSYEIVKKVVIKKGKTISITRESNNILHSFLFFFHIFLKTLLVIL